jgi:hypothetical protein
MATEDGDLMVLAIQRGGIEMRDDLVVLRAGEHLSDPKVLVVDSLEVVQKQVVALGQGAIKQSPSYCCSSSCLPSTSSRRPGRDLRDMVITRVMTLPQFYGVSLRYSIDARFSADRQT